MADVLNWIAAVFAGLLVLMLAFAFNRFLWLTRDLKYSPDMHEKEVRDFMRSVSEWEHKCR